MIEEKCRPFRSQSKVVTVLPESGVHIMLFQHRHRDVFMHNSPITGCTTSSNSNELKHVPLQLFCTVLVLAKDVCVILHNLVHFMGCWIHVNLLMLSDMQALHTQRTLIDLSLTIDRTKLGLLWMFDERQCRNNKTISPQSFQNEESYSSDLLKMTKTYFLLLRDISWKTKILPNLRGSRLSVPNFIAIRPNIPLDYLH